MIIVPFPISTRPQYVKKEDVKQILITQRKVYLPVVILSLLAVVWVIQLVVFPQIMNIYDEFTVSLPPSVQIFPYVTLVISVIGIGFCLYLWKSEPDFNEVETQLNNYKDGEMVSLVKFLNPHLEWIILVFIGLYVAFMVYSIVMPIYNMTATL